MKLNPNPCTRTSTYREGKRKWVETFKVLSALFIGLLFMGGVTACKDNSTKDFQKSQNELFKPSVDPNSLMKEPATPDTTTIDTASTDTTE